MSRRHVCQTWCWISAMSCYVLSKSILIQGWIRQRDKTRRAERTTPDKSLRSQAGQCESGHGEFVRRQRLSDMKDLGLMRWGVHSYATQGRTGRQRRGSATTLAGKVTMNQHTHSFGLRGCRIDETQVRYTMGRRTWSVLCSPAAMPVASRLIASGQLIDKGLISNNMSGFKRYQIARSQRTLGECSLIFKHATHCSHNIMQLAPSK